MKEERTMQRQTELAPVVRPLCSCEAFSCAVQVLVIDHINGPASVLIDTVSLLLDRDISVTTVDEHADALRALDYYHFDLVVVGLYEQRPFQLTILPRIHQMHPETAILAVGRHLPRLYRQYARNYGAREILNMPERAADLKTLIAHMAERYLKISA
jgi:DNA-binding NtrC family response regulator